MTISNELPALIPDWPAPGRVRSLSTIRPGGVSQGAWAGFNLGQHVGDDPRAVAANRAQLSAAIGASPRWLEQVHGIAVLDAATLPLDGPPPRADASFVRRAAVPCVVMTADCLPVLFCDDAGTVVVLEDEHLAGRHEIYPVVVDAYYALASLFRYGCEQRDRPLLCIQLGLYRVFIGLWFAAAFID